MAKISKVLARYSNLDEPGPSLVKFRPDSQIWQRIVKFGPDSQIWPRIVKFGPDSQIWTNMAKLSKV